MKRTTLARPPVLSPAVEIHETIVQSPRGIEVVSEIGAILAIHLAAAVAVVWTLAGLGIG